MHPNPTFHIATRDENLAFARERGFGMLALSSDGAPHLSHVPFIISEDGTAAELHLARSSATARAAKETRPATLAVTGPDGYISPDWYDMPDQVPTWNYVAVHLSGRLVPLPDTALRDQLDRLSEAFETRLLPKPVWQSSKMDAEALSRLLRMIRPFRFEIDDVQGTWKFSQNKPDAARLGAASHVAGSSIGSDLALLSGLMQAPIEKAPK
ncbi:MULTISPECIES: FMN-binding negative transcriptional regulator [Shimia]|uniref:FMN-binding negative transcriptional regulator n=1 Tax=Shimia TaxID=573139 RepID=UPI001FB55E16|nr:MULTISPECIES: FMN-binding negative transcriptional regulator [Shimia]MDV4144779.1 FMN-binding negative transcriptional regulator [Shimia sp. FJ5]